MPITLNIILVFVGAGFGALLRFAFTLFFDKFGFIFNLGTLSANLLGAFLAGIISTLILQVEVFQNLRPFLIVGFLGGLTTFSSFTLEMIYFLENEKLLNLGILIAIHTIGSLLFGLFGMWLALKILS
ncbi:MAG: CrcB family protein [Campylobacter sp.]|nr:CrcB family protein [Campylobacter sp.]